MRSLGPYSWARLSAFGSATTGLIAEDGLHPTQAGYIKMAETFFETIKSTLETNAGRITLGPADPGLLPLR